MKKIIIFVIIAFFISTFAYSSIDVEVNELMEFDFDKFYVTSFINVVNPQDQEEIFELIISNPDTTTYACRITLEILSTVHGYLLSRADGLINRYNGPPFNSKSSYLELSTDEEISITNIDLIDTDLSITGDWSDIRDEHSDMIVSFLPAGTYTFNLYVSYVDVSDALNYASDQEYPNVISPPPVTVQVTNPSTIDLISPGEPFSGNPPEIEGNLPIFSWFSDANEFDIKIFEVEANETEDDIIYKEPLFSQEEWTGNIFPYPNDAPLLEENRTYAWRVIGVVSTTQGDEFVEVELWCFKIAGGEGIDPEVASINEFLENLINFGLIDADLLAFGGFAPTGEIYLNGELFTVDDLLQLMNSFLSGDYEVIGVEVE